MNSDFFTFYRFNFNFVEIHFNGVALALFHSHFISKSGKKIILFILMKIELKFIAQTSSLSNYV